MKAWLTFGKEKIDLSSVSPVDCDFFIRPGGWLHFYIKIDGKVMLFKTRSIQNKKDIFMWINGHIYKAVIKEKTSAATSLEGDSEAILKAQFPGKIRKILVKEGDSVLEGEKLLLLEAMKMEFAIQAGFSTKVLKINVKEGEQVSPGAVLIELEVKKND